MGSGCLGTPHAADHANPPAESVSPLENMRGRRQIADHLRISALLAIINRVPALPLNRHLVTVAFVISQLHGVSEPCHGLKSA